MAFCTMRVAAAEDRTGSFKEGTPMSLLYCTRQSTIEALVRFCLRACAPALNPVSPRSSGGAGDGSPLVSLADRHECATFIASTGATPLSLLKTPKHRASIAFQ